MFSSSLGYGQCNGDSALCNKRFNEVSYVTTHNAFNYEGAFQLPNQGFPVSQQLQDGVRAFMLDVYLLFGTPTLFHNQSTTGVLGNEPLEDMLVDMKQFLDLNPNEVISIIFECNVTANEMDTVFTSSGVKPYVYTQTTGQTWPTLQSMIDDNKRLVVFSDVDDAGPGQDWYHYVWDFCVETDYSAASRADFSCNFNRGDSLNGLFILNHFITGISGVEDSAILINANPYLTNRVNQCMSYQSRLPNFLTVDFYEEGDVMSTVDLLNESYTEIDEKRVSEGPIMKVFPNPFSELANIFVNNSARYKGATLRIVDMMGRELENIKLDNDNYIELDGTSLESGVYSIFLFGGGSLLESQRIVRIR
jgi:hypothetical protein